MHILLINKDYVFLIFVLYAFLYAFFEKDTLVV